MQGNNPYQQPGADVSAAPEAAPLVVNAPRSRDIGAGWRWISDAWRIFKSAWAQVFFGVVLMWLLSMAVQFVPILGLIAPALLAPVLTVGILVLAWKADEGQNPEVGDIFAGFKNKFGQLVLLGLSMLGLTMIAILLGIILGMVVFSGSLGGFVTTMESLEAGQAHPDILMQLMLAGLVMLALMVPVMAAYWFAPALVFFGNQGIGDALVNSFKGCLKNILPMFWYGVVAMLLVILAIIPLGLGLLILLPVLTVSYYSSFRDIYTDTL